MVTVSTGRRGGESSGAGAQRAGDHGPDPAGQLGGRAGAGDRPAGRAGRRRARGRVLRGNANTARGRGSGRWQVPRLDSATSVASSSARSRRSPWASVSAGSRASYHVPTLKQHLAAVRGLIDWLGRRSGGPVEPGRQGAGTNARSQAGQDAGSSGPRKCGFCSTRSRRLPPLGPSPPVEKDVLSDSRPLNNGGPLRVAGATLDGLDEALGHGRHQGRRRHRPVVH